MSKKPKATQLDLFALAEANVVEAPVKHSIFHDQISIEHARLLENIPVLVPDGHLDEGSLRHAVRILEHGWRFWKIAFDEEVRKRNDATR